MRTVVFIYIFLFVCLFKIQATQQQPQPKQQQQPKDCVKHPQIVKPHPTEKVKIVTEKIVKSTPSGLGNSIPHFSVLNFINFFYTKDTLDNLHVM